MTTRAIDWSQRFTRGANAIKSSMLRDLLKVIARPGMISFVGGMPASELFPVDRIEAAIHEVFQRLGGRAMQYGETEGVPELRDWIARRYSTEALQLTRENVLITTGAQQALDVVGRVFLDEGDHVIVENPTYLAALQAWQGRNAKFLTATSDDSGMKVDGATPLFERQPKFAYLIPNFHNPTGVLMSLERRKHLLDVAQIHGVPVLEDDPYGELRYEGEGVAGLLELGRSPDDGGVVIRTGTFSKTVVPGLRVGWVIGPRAVIERLGRAKQGMDLHTSTFSQHLLLELVNTGYIEEMVPKLRAAYRERRDAMLEALGSYFPAGSHWLRPQGGMFVYATLPEGISAAKLLIDALKREVAFVPGEEFCLEGAGRNSMRLNFTKSNAAEIKEGVRRLGEAISLSNHLA